MRGEWTKSISEINGRIRANQSVVWTEAQIREQVAANILPETVDVMTVAFQAPIAGTAAMMCVPVAGRGVFTRAEEISLNGVAGTPGPAPNERLGVVDTMICADTKQKDGSPGYTGANLLRDIIDGVEIDIECVAVEGSRHKAKTRLSELEFARFYVYNAFVDADFPKSVLSSLGRGSRVLLNGANGIIVGAGTRDAVDRRSWSIAANMHGMSSSLMDCFGTPEKPSLGNMIAIAIPVVRPEIYIDLKQWVERSASLQPIAVASGCLRDRILQGRFTLTDTDYAI